MIALSWHDANNRSKVRGKDGTVLYFEMALVETRRSCSMSKRLDSVCLYRSPFPPIQAFHCQSVYPFNMSYCPYNGHDADPSFMMLFSEPWAMYPEGYPSVDVVGKSGKCCGVQIPSLNNRNLSGSRFFRQGLPRRLSGLHSSCPKSGTMDQR
jgi:hypothetical protein